MNQEILFLVFVSKANANFSKNSCAKNPPLTLYLSQYSTKEFSYYSTSNLFIDILSSLIQVVMDPTNPIQSRRVLFYWLPVSHSSDWSTEDSTRGW